MYEFALLAAIAALACGLLVPVVKPIAIRLGAVDTPGGRRLHSHEVPRLGGVAIFAAFLITLAVAWSFHFALPAAANVNPHGVLAFATAGTLVFGLGVVDDLRSVRPLAKLIVQLGAALLVVIWGGCRIEGVSMPGGTVGTGSFSIPLTVLWIVLITNAVNLLDGLDGLAAGVVAIALLGVIAITHVEHVAVAATAAIVIGACAGFLVHNFHPAKIFMGDSGSLFLGFALAVLSTYASAKAATGAVVLPVLIAAIPLSDALWAVARRYLKGIVPISVRGQLAAMSRVFVPDRAHIHHRLLDAGLTQRQVVLVLYGVQVALCLMTTYVAAHMVAASAVPH